MQGIPVIAPILLPINRLRLMKIGFPNDFYHATGFGNSCSLPLMKSISRQVILLLLFITGFKSEFVHAQRLWSLKACADSAFKKNISIRQGLLNTETNKINYDQSRAARLPNLNLSDNQNLSSGFVNSNLY
jgi:hypothetical protein